jgi:hypothetical protein
MRQILRCLGFYTDPYNNCYAKNFKIRRSKMSLRDEIKKSMAEARAKVAQLKKAEEEKRDKTRAIEEKMFIPIKEALQILSEESTENRSIQFYNTLSNCLIKIENNSNLYELSVSCVAFPEDEGFRFSYLWSITDKYEGRELVHTYFPEGHESDLLNRIMTTLASYEENGYLTFQEPFNSNETA